MKYLIIDDEPIAHEIIEEYATNFPQLVLQKNCYNVFQATEHLNNEQIDLIFLDINMPKISGFDFLRSLTNPPKIIVTTAYKEYAIEGYELDIVDYLLKPFSLQRFLKAVNKATDLQQKTTAKHFQSDLKNTILLKDGKKTYQTRIDAILFVEAYGNYTKVVTKERTIVTQENLYTYLEKLPAKEFIQIHKSFIVAISNIELMEDNKVLINDVKIPIGITFKHNFMQHFKKH